MKTQSKTLQLRGALLLRKPRSADVLLVAIALCCLAIAGYHQLTRGWSTLDDYTLIACGIASLICLVLPFTVRINVLVFVALLSVLELSSYLVLSFGSQPAVNRIYRDTTGAIINTWWGQNKEMGYQPLSNIQVSVSAKREANPVYDVTYSIDDYHRRATPSATDKVPRKYIIFFGCSTTFGDGVNDDETLPYYLSKLAPSYRPYNYGFNGYGPQHVLAKLQTTALRGEVKEPDGIALYGFIDDHVDRLINRMVNNWIHRSPYYFLDAEGRVQRSGTFNTARPVLYYLYNNILLKSHTLRLLGVDFPPRLTDEHLQLTCKVIEESYHLYQKQMKNDNFYVVFRATQNADALGRQLIPCLEKAGVRYIDYSARAWPDEFVIKDDGHPSATGHQATAHWLARDLGVDERNNGRH